MIYIWLAAAALVAAAGALAWLIGPLIGPWRRARAAGMGVPFPFLITLRLRGGNAGMVMDALALLREAGSAAPPEFVQLVHLHCPEAAGSPEALARRVEEEEARLAAKEAAMKAKVRARQGRRPHASGDAGVSEAGVHNREAE